MDRNTMIAVITGIATVAAAGITGIYTLKSTKIKNQPPVITELKISPVAPQMAHTPIMLSASATDKEGDTIRFKFSAKLKGAKTLETIQDWSTQQNCEWTPVLPGEYEILAEVKDGFHESSSSDDTRSERYNIVAWSEILPSTPGVETPEGVADELYQRALQLEAKGNLSEALKLYEASIQKDATFRNGYGHVKRGKMLLGLGRYPEAIKAFELAIAQNGAESTAWNGKAVAHYKLGQLNEGLKAIDIAIKTSPKDATLLSNKCGMLREEKVARYTDALAACEEALKLKPNSAVTLNHKGGALYSLGRYTEAVEVYNKALKVDPMFSLAWYNQCTAWYQLGKYEEALKSCNKALEITPTYVAAQNVIDLIKQDVQDRGH